MKVNHNDIKTKSLKNIKKSNMHKNPDIPSKNYPRMVSPILQPNKTIQKYISERLNSIKLIKNNVKKEKINSNIQPRLSVKNSNILMKNNLIISPIRKNNKKHIQVIKKKKKLNSKKKEKNESKDNSTERNISKQIIFKKKQNTKESKLFSSTSASSGISLYSNENKKNQKFSQKEKNSKEFIYNYNSNKKVNSKNLEKSYIDNPCINNFNYESGNDDILSEKKIFLKCDNSSLLTFGNSFSYSNSQRTISNKKNENDQNKNFLKDITINYNTKKNIYVNKLKEENETLKKELKESSEQISHLIYQIKELKQNKIINYRSKNFIRNNKICSPNIWKNRYMKNSILEKDNYKYSRNDIDKKIEKSYLFNQENAKIKFNKEILKDINRTINDKNCENCRKKIHIKRKLHLNKKENNKSKNSISSIDKSRDNISECISKLKI